MSGLLRRLAARTLGVAPAVRPRLEWSTHADSRTDADSAPPVDWAVSESDAPAWQVPGRAPEIAHPIGGPRSVDAPSTESSTLDAAVAGPPPSERRAPRSVLPHADARSPEGTPAQDRARTQAEDPPIDRRANRRVEPDADRAMDAPAIEGPALLPSRRFTPALSPRAIAATPSHAIGAARPRVEETTEVRVSIGRIEVTAVPEPAAPQREPAGRRRPKSLDEYLAERQGRRA